MGVYVVFMKIPSPTAVRVFKKNKGSCWTFLMCLIMLQTGSSGPVSALSFCFSLHHCPFLKGQSLGHPHPSPSPQCPGRVTHPLQRCFQLQEKAGVC